MLLWQSPETETSPQKAPKLSAKAPSTGAAHPSTVESKLESKRFLMAETETEHFFTKA